MYVGGYEQFLLFFSMTQLHAGLRYEYDKELTKHSNVMKLWTRFQSTLITFFNSHNYGLSPNIYIYIYIFSYVNTFIHISLCNSMS